MLKNKMRALRIVRVLQWTAFLMFFSGPIWVLYDWEVFDKYFYHYLATYMIIGTVIYAIKNIIDDDEI
jgi:hypothetical protein